MNTEIPLYRLIGIKKSYGAKTVLDITDLQFQSGKIHILVGPNGSGKTTLLNILSFLDRPSGGELFFKNQTVAYENSNLYKLRQSVTLVLQNHFLFSTTVFDNVAYGLKQKGLADSLIKQKVTDALTLVNLREFSDRPARQLSGGESKRVTLARALVLEPEILCLDEPTANIDRRNEESIENIISRINAEKGATVIMTTHDLHQAYRLGQQIFSMINGKIIPRDVGIENIFSGELKETDGLKYLELKPGVKVYVDTDHLGHSHICINPRHIILSRERFHSSARNVMTGQITNLNFQGNLVRVTINVGVDLTAFITRSSFEDLKLTLGETVTATFKTASVLVP